MKNEEKKDFGSAEYAVSGVVGITALSVGEILLESYNSFKIKPEEIAAKAEKIVAETLGKTGFKELFNEIVRDPAAKADLEQYGLKFSTEFSEMQDGTAWKAVTELVGKIELELQEKDIALNNYQTIGLTLAATGLAISTGLAVNAYRNRNVPETRVETPSVKLNEQRVQETADAGRVGGN